MHMYTLLSTVPGTEQALRKCWPFLPLYDIHKGYCADIWAVAALPLFPPLPPSFSSYPGSREQTWLAYSAAGWFSWQNHPKAWLPNAPMFTSSCHLVIGFHSSQSGNNEVTFHKCQVFYYDII